MNYCPISASKCIKTHENICCKLNNCICMCVYICMYIYIHIYIYMSYPELTMFLLWEIEMQTFIEFKEHVKLTQSYGTISAGLSIDFETHRLWHTDPWEWRWPWGEKQLAFKCFILGQLNPHLWMLPQAGSRLCFSEHLIPIQRLLPTRSPGRFWVIGTRPQAIGKKKKKERERN